MDYQVCLIFQLTNLLFLTQFSRRLTMLQLPILNIARSHIKLQIKMAQILGLANTCHTAQSQENFKFKVINCSHHGLNFISKETFDCK